MKTKTGMCTLLLLVSLSSFAQSGTRTSGQQGGIFPKGNPAPVANFTGTVWLQPLVPDDSTYNCVVGSVTFEPGARSNWHTHPAGQLLLVTDGIGYYQEKGKPIQLMHKGDVFKCPPDTEHWHGASPTNPMTHLSIVPNSEKGVVVWLKKVTDQEYTKRD